MIMNIHESPMPAIYIGHGTPMNAVGGTSYADAWRAIGRELPRPKAVLVVSAHWFVDETAVTAMAQPPTIHDFGGFPRRLYEIEYPAPGDPELAVRIQNLLKPFPVRLDFDTWGLDHGAWTVLVHMFPRADIPAIELSIDGTKPPEYHYELAKRLAPLRDEGVLVIGSGGLVLNLREYAAWRRNPSQSFDWAVRFERRVRELLIAGDDMPLVDYRSLGRDALMSAPTPEHYLPLIYVLGVRRPGDRVLFPVEGMEGGGSVSMLSVELKAAA